MRSIILFLFLGMVVPFTLTAQQVRKAREKVESVPVGELLSRFAEELETPPRFSSQYETVLVKLLRDSSQKERGDSVLNGLTSLGMEHASGRVRSLAATMIITGSDGAGASGRSILQPLMEIYGGSSDPLVRLSILSAVPLLPGRDHPGAVTWMEALVQRPSDELRATNEAEEAVRALARLPQGRAKLKGLMEENKILDGKARTVAALILSGGGD